LREAIFNALIHRDYNTTSSIEIKIYNSSLSIANEGKMPPEITIDDLKREHLSKPRNKLLADIFYKAGFIESWGRGTLKIIRECKIANIPEPLFSEDHGVVKIIFTLTGTPGKFQNGELNGELNIGQQKVFNEIMLYCDCLSLQTQTLSITESKQVCICKPAKIQYKSGDQCQFDF
jgi:predicted HTH transcriptional regulator